MKIKIIAIFLSLFIFISISVNAMDWWALVDSNRKEQKLQERKKQAQATDELIQLLQKVDIRHPKLPESRDVFIKKISDFLQQGADVKGEIPILKPDHFLQGRWHDSKIGFLAYAISIGDPVIVQLFIEYGANLLLTNSDKLSDLIQYDETPLMMAVRKSNIEIIRLLIEAAKKLNFDIQTYLNMKNGSGDSALTLAISDSNIVKLLLENGANPVSRDNDGRTPLMNAALYGKIESVRLLIDAAKQIFDKELAKISKEQSSYLHVLPKDVVDIISQYKQFRQLSDYINAQDSKGYTALMYSVLTWKYKDRNDIQNIPLIVRLIISSGADITLDTKEGFNAFELFSENSSSWRAYKWFKEIRDLLKPGGWNYEERKKQRDQKKETTSIFMTSEDE